MTTCGELIERVDREAPNKFTAQEKLGWLTLCDREVYAVMAQYKDAPEWEAHDSVEDVLLCGDGDLYAAFCEAKIGYIGGEMARYANAQALYNERFRLFRNRYNASHEAISEKIRYF